MALRQKLIRVHDSQGMHWGLPLHAPLPAAHSLARAEKGKAVQIGTKAHVDAWLAQIGQTLAGASLPNMPSVLISGTKRCGKSKVAKALAARTGHVVVKTDHMRNAMMRGLDEPARRRVAKYAQRMLLLRFARGIILEGTGLVDAPCEMPLWAARRGFPVHIIGYAAGTPEAKAEDLLAYRAAHKCWTKRNLSDAKMLPLARQIIRRSRALRRYCKAHDLPYHDLDSRAFASECARIVAQIETGLDVVPR